MSQAFASFDTRSSVSLSESKRWIDTAKTSMKPPRSNARLAFSLVELIVVIIIIGLLSSLVAVQTRSYLIASRQNAAKAEIATIVSALESFYADQSRYPTNDEGIAILIQSTPSFPSGFLKKIPKDPWGRAYEYVSPATKSPFDVVCLGADGREGGTGSDMDISSEALDAKNN